MVTLGAGADLVGWGVVIVWLPFAPVNQPIPMRLGSANIHGPGRPAKWRSSAPV